MARLKDHDRRLLPHALALFPLPGMLERLLTARDAVHRQVEAGTKEPGPAKNELAGMIRTPIGSSARNARTGWLNVEHRELVAIAQRRGAAQRPTVGEAAARAAQAAVRQRMMQRWQDAQDQKLASVPHVQSPSGQAAVSALMQKRNELQSQVATGELTAPEAKAELDTALATGEGAAVAAQDQTTAREWQTTAEQTIDATAQAATAQAAVATAAPSSARGAIAPLLLSALGAGAGYAAAEDQKAQATYAAVGGVVGLVAGLIVNKVRQRRAATAPAVVATEATAPAAAPAATPAAPATGVSGLWR